MKYIPNSSPRTFKCKMGEKITIIFTPKPENALSLIKYCFEQSCPENVQQEVDGDEFTFTIDSQETLLQIFFFFIPAVAGAARGKCNVLLTSSTGETFPDPVPAEESTTGDLPRKIYIFEV